MLHSVKRFSRKSQYSNLEYDPVYNSWGLCLPCIEIYFRCGFERKQINDEWQLIFNPDKSQKLKETIENGEYTTFNTLPQLHHKECE